MSDNKDATSVPDTGHVWDDDLRDLTNQPPKWWMLGLTASGIWVLVYWLIYPSIPIPAFGVNDHWKGLLHWSAIGELKADQSVVDNVRKKYEDKIKGMTPAAILADRDLTEYVTRSGKVLFGDNCAACHGTNGVGAKDKEGLVAPILNDDDWLFGGSIESIHESIQNGRKAVMTAHKDTLSAQQVDDVAKWVKAASEGKAEAAEVAAGKKVFGEVGCTACHGPDGKGMHAMGSANLVDKVWRFDGTLAGIKQTISFGVNSGDPKARMAEMPSFKAAGKLSDAEMKKLAVYVYKFGGGQAAAPAAPAAPAAAEAPAAAVAAAPADKK